MAGFKVIGMKLKEMYRMITLGGDADLELVDSLDPFSEGIQARATPHTTHHTHALTSPHPCPHTRSRPRTSPMPVPHPCPYLTHA
eukprot:2170774-Prymnesium_polylepis.1